MKKSLLTVGLSLAMVLTMATPAFAANTEVNVNPDGTLVTAPGNPSYVNGGNVQTGGMSYNEANITSKDGTTWATVNDDDALAGAADANGADINVWAKVVDSGSKVYKVDLAWGAMKFEYNSGSNQWNPATHAYDKSTGTAAWTETGFVDGTNNKVAITNHSNNAINAAFAYKMEGTKFNEVAGLNNVAGHFFDTNPKAVTASKVLTGTFTDTAGTESALVLEQLAKAGVALATAEAYNDGTTAQPVGARTDEVYFAFSGTPDSGKGKVLDTFKKVGVITVTVTPNNDANLNAAK